MRYFGNFVTLFVSCFILTPLSARSILLEKIVASVDDEIITLSDMHNYRQKIQTKKLNDDFLNPNVKELLGDDKKLLEHLIDEKLLDSEIKKQNLSVTIERVEQEIRRIANQNKIDRAQFKEVLSREGISFADYQHFIKTQLERRALVEKEITSKIKITEDDVTAFYIAKMGSNANKDTFEYSISHILFTIKSGDDKGAKERGQLVLEKLKQGQNFEELAANHSEDPGFSSGGTLGVFKSGEMLPEFEKSVTKLEVGQYSNLLKTKMGYHIIKLTKKRIVSDPQFQKEKASIEARLFQQAFEKQLRYWLAKKRQESFIRKN